MDSFDYLPLEMKEAIFVHLLDEDRYECAKVSRQWFHLTLKTYKPRKALVRPADQFLGYCLKLCKRYEADGISSFWELLQLMRNVTVQYTEENAPYVRKYAGSIRKVVLYQPEHIGQLIPFVETHIVDGHLVAVDNLEDAALKQQGVGSVRTRSFVVPTMGWPILFGPKVKPEWITEITLSSCNLRSIFAGLTLILKNLTGLEKLIIRDFKLTRNLRKIFPPNITTVCLYPDTIAADLTALLGPEHDRGRQAMFFLCQNWRTLRHFEILPYGFAGSRYTFSRRKRIETLPLHVSYKSYAEVEMPPSWSFVQSEADLSDGYTKFRKSSILGIIPETARSVALRLQYPFIFDDVCFARPQMECLTLQNYRFLKFSHARERVPFEITSLVILRLDDPCTCVEPSALAKILTVCTSLRTLHVHSESNALSIIPESVVSRSIQELKYLNFGDDLERVFNRMPNIKIFKIHKGALKKGPWNSISKLKLFSMNCIYRREMWNEFKSTRATYKVLAVDTGTRHGFIACGEDVQLLRKEMRQEWQNVEDGLVLVHGMGVEHTNWPLESNCFVDPEAFEEAIDRKLPHDPEIVVQPCPSNV